MIADKKIEPNINCNLCRKKFNLSSKRPKCLIPCGHTYCEQCIVNIFENKCPSCHFRFNQSIPDYQTIDFIKNASSIAIDLKQNKLVNIQKN